MYSLGQGDLDAQLCIIHFKGEFANAVETIIPRLVGDCGVIAVLSRSTLALVVDVMQGSERVAGMMIMEISTRGS